MYPTHTLRGRLAAGANWRAGIALIAQRRPVVVPVVRVTRASNVVPIRG